MQNCGQNFKGKRHIEKTHAWLGYQVKMGLQGTKHEALGWIRLRCLTYSRHPVSRIRLPGMQFRVV